MYYIVILPTYVVYIVEKWIGQMPAAKCYILHSLYRFEQVSKYFPHISCYFLLEMGDGENIQKS